VTGRVPPAPSGLVGRVRERGDVADLVTGRGCREAAAQVVARGEWPLPPTMVLPLAAATRVVALPDFPEDDGGRVELLERFADEEMRAANAPAYGFLAEGLAADAAGAPVEVVVVVYGARGHHPLIVAAPLEGEALGAFTEPEPLEPTAMPFLRPVEHAVDAATPPDAMPLV
jgi:hypothetical protein